MVNNTPSQVIYIDLDSCYYNVARRLYHLRPWTVIVNNCNHMISVPHWLDGHFGAKKMTYFVPPVKAKIKVKRPVRIFNVDEGLPGGSSPRDAIKEVVGLELSRVKEFLPSARLVRKDSIVAECANGLPRGKLTALPYTMGAGLSEEEAKTNCAEEKARKRLRSRDWVLLSLFLLPMVVDYAISEIRRRTRNEDH